MSTWDALRLALWMFMTQRNGKGPRRFLGLFLLEWIGLAAVAAAALLGYWLIFRLYVSMAALVWMRGGAG